MKLLLLLAITLFFGKIAMTYVDPNQISIYDGATGERKAAWSLTAPYPASLGISPYDSSIYFGYSLPVSAYGYYFPEDQHVYQYDLAGNLLNSFQMPVIGSTPNMAFMLSYIDPNTGNILNTPNSFSVRLLLYDASGNLLKTSPTACRANSALGGGSPVAFRDPYIYYVGYQGGNQPYPPSYLYKFDADLNLISYSSPLTTVSSNGYYKDEVIYCKFTTSGFALLYHKNGLNYGAEDYWVNRYDLTGNLLSSTQYPGITGLGNGSSVLDVTDDGKIYYWQNLNGGTLDAESYVKCQNPSGSVWSDRYAPSFLRSCALRDGYIYLLQDNSTLYKISCSDGSLIWSKSFARLNPEKVYALPNGDALVYTKFPLTYDIPKPYMVSLPGNTQLTSSGTSADKPIEVKPSPVRQNNADNYGNVWSTIVCSVDGMTPLESPDPIYFDYNNSTGVWIVRGSGVRSLLVSPLDNPAEGEGTLNFKAQFTPKIHNWWVVNGVLDTNPDSLILNFPIDFHPSDITFYMPFYRFVDELYAGTKDKPAWMTNTCGDIHFTVDGSEPTEASPIFSEEEGITLNESVTLKAASVYAGELGNVCQQYYSGVCRAPFFTPAEAKELIDPLEVTLTNVTEGCDIYYFWWIFNGEYAYIYVDESNILYDSNAEPPTAPILVTRPHEDDSVHYMAAATRDGCEALSTLIDIITHLSEHPGYDALCYEFNTGHYSWKYIEPPAPPAPKGLTAVVDIWGILHVAYELGDNVAYCQASPADSAFSEPVEIGVGARPAVTCEDNHLRLAYEDSNRDLIVKTSHDFGQTWS